MNTNNDLEADMEKAMDADDSEILICFNSFLDLDLYKIMQIISKKEGKSLSETFNEHLRNYFKIPKRKKNIKRNIFTSHFWDDWKLTRHKFLTYRYGRYDQQKVFDMKYFKRRNDHAGFDFDLTILGRTFQLEIYDSRHWCYKEKRFYKPEEEEMTSKSSKIKKRGNSKL